MYLQHQVARRVAADLEVLPGHEIHIDPALLFFILKVHRDRILEDTTMALQKATPEDLRRQLKVVFEGGIFGVEKTVLRSVFTRRLLWKTAVGDIKLKDVCTVLHSDMCISMCSICPCGVLLADI